MAPPISSVSYFANVDIPNVDIPSPPPAAEFLADIKDQFIPDFLLWLSIAIGILVSLWLVRSLASS